MAFVICRPCSFDVQLVGLIDCHPDRRRPFVPLLYGELFWLMGDGIGVLSGLHERQQVIRHHATRLRAVAAQLLVEQADVLRQRPLDNRAFPDRAARMENPPGTLVNVVNTAAENLVADRLDTLRGGHKWDSTFSYR